MMKKLGVEHDTKTTIASNTTRLTACTREPRCRICNSPLRRTFVDLGMSPRCESQLDQMEAGGGVAQEPGIPWRVHQRHDRGPLPRRREVRARPYYPLHALVCEECFLVQLKEYVSPDHIVSEYAYFSLASTRWVAHARSYCHMAKERLQLGPHSLVIELASKDGYLLQHFLRLGVPVLGIERAANEAEAVCRRDFPTLFEYFGAALAVRLVAEGKRADLIVANNVLAQVPDLNDFVAGMTLLLAPEGVITLEFPHLERLIAESQFDTIYHEHLFYFSLVTVNRLAESHGLKIIDVEKLRTHGGSLRVYLTHTGSARPASPRVAELLEQEIAAGFLEIETYARFSEQVRRTKRNLLSFLIAAKNQGKSICGYGAASKGNTLLNYCAIGTDFLDFAVDHNPYKHGRFMPGTHIPIKPVKAIDAAKPDYVLLLHLHLKDEITHHQMRRISDWGGRFVVPIPEVRVIEPMRSVS